MKKPVCEEVGFGHILSYNIGKRERKNHTDIKKKDMICCKTYIHSHNVSKFRPEKWKYIEESLRKDTAGYAGFKEVLRTATVSTRYQKFDQISYWLYRPD